MIPDKVNALFQFIEYLHSKIEDFNQHNDLITELEQLLNERNTLKPEINFKDKQRYDEVQDEIKIKLDVLHGDTANLIKAKAVELNVCSYDGSPITNFNGLRADLFELKKNFNNSDLPIITEYKNKYLEYRSKTHKTFLTLELFFVDLDRVLKDFFDFFAINEGETDILKEKVFRVKPAKQETDYLQNDIEDNTLISQYAKAILELIKGGDTGCFPQRFRTLPQIVLSEKEYSIPRKKYILKQMRLLLDEVKHSELGSELFTDLQQRVEPYEQIFSFVFSNTTTQPQGDVKPKPELKLNEFFIEEVSSDTIEAIQTEFNELEGKDLAILIYLLHKEYKKIEILTNSRTKGRKGFVKCLKETDNPKMQKVNKCFVPNTDDLIYSKDDLVFQSLNKRLTKIIKI